MKLNLKWTAFPITTLIALTVSFQSAISAERNSAGTALNRSPKIEKSAPQVIAQAATEERLAEGKRLLKTTYEQHEAKQYAAAINTAKRANAIFQELRDPTGQVLSLYLMGKSHQALSQHQAAIATFEQALPLFSQASDLKVIELDVRLSLGASYVVTDKYTPAIQHLEVALPMAKALNDKKSEATSTLVLGTAYLGSGQFAKAIPMFEQASALYSALNDAESVATAQKGLGYAKQFLARSKQ